MKECCAAIFNLLPILVLVGQSDDVKGMEVVGKALCTAGQLTDLSTGWTGHTIGLIWIQCLKK